MYYIIVVHIFLKCWNVLSTECKNISKAIGLCSQLHHLLKYRLLWTVSTSLANVMNSVQAHFFSFGIHIHVKQQTVIQCALNGNFLHVYINSQFFFYFQIHGTIETKIIIKNWQTNFSSHFCMKWNAPDVAVFASLNHFHSKSTDFFLCHIKTFCWCWFSRGISLVKPLDMILNDKLTKICMKKKLVEICHNARNSKKKIR